MYCKLDSPSCEKELGHHCLQMTGLHKKKKLSMICVDMCS